MAKYIRRERDPGSALRLITSVTMAAVRGRPVDLLKLECGHEVVSRMLNHHKVGTKTHCSQCRR